MDKHRLMEYQKLKREQALLLRRITALQAKDVPIVTGKVKASSRDFPYTEHRVSVQMHEPVEADRIIRMKQIYEARQKKVEQQMLEIETFIDGIDDTEIRQIFELRFIEGQKQEQIAKVMHLERSSVSRKISAYFQLSHNSQKSML